MRRRGIHIRPIIAGIMLVVVGGNLMGQTVEEWQDWAQLQNDRIETTATVLSAHASINSSGQITKYTVSYEFTAPGTKGSSVSAADVQAQLEAQFNNPDEPVPAIPETPAPAGESFIRGSQILSPDQYRRFDSDPTLPVIYSASDPSNSAIEGTKGYPTSSAIGITALILLGGGLTLFGLYPLVRR